LQEKGNFDSKTFTPNKIKIKQKYLELLNEKINKYKTLLAPSLSQNRAKNIFEW